MRAFDPHHFLLLILLCGACAAEEELPSPPPIGSAPEGCDLSENGWTIPTVTVADGGVGQDGIPSIENPQFILASEVDFLTDRELVIALKVNDDIRIYPQRILDQHEIVNDRVGGVAISLTFCPLTGTAIAFERTVDGAETTLGVSGLLFNNNLILYDRSTNTRWVQMTFEGVNGPFYFDQLDFLPSVEMSWSAMKALYPNARVLSKATGFDKRYANEALSSRTPLDSDPAFPYEPRDDRLPNFQRVLMVRDSSEATVFPLDEFERSLDIISDGQLLLIVHPEVGFMVAYEWQPGLNFAAVENTPGVIMEDQNGNAYDVFGEVVEGPDRGFKLEPTLSYMGYWFAIAAMAPDPFIFRSGMEGD
ncbi:MAG: DUF3179 domain-containing protein [Bacteroidota bacterium]